MLNIRRVSIAALALLALALAWLGGAITAAGAGSAPAAKREELAAQKNPIGARGRTLALSRVTIPAGVRLPLHYHQGTQVSYIDQGVLSYTVKTGSVRVMTGPADESPRFVRTIRAGQTGTLRAGEWIVEQPSDHHTAKAKVRVVVLLATLLQNGAPPATPVK